MSVGSHRPFQWRIARQDIRANTLSPKGRIETQRIPSLGEVLSAFLDGDRLDTWHAPVPLAAHSKPQGIVNGPDARTSCSAISYRAKATPHFGNRKELN